MKQSEIFSIIEGILFVSNESITLLDIANAFGITALEASKIMEEMMISYENDESRGIKVVQMNDKFSLVTKQNIFGYLTKINSSLEKPKISPAMLETLAIIAYKQPVTKLEIENIRGVKSDHAVNKLVEYELVCEVGRAEKIGRPILFGTTDKFLIYFGLKTLEELPNLKSNSNEEVKNLDINANLDEILSANINGNGEVSNNE